ncbi:MAG TPA: trehalose-phosphatase [Planctomycetaceae bacterium]|jgi:trehalose 6-phosphate phosphatase|nr:trehalose-phosphatase [Planctomycetaceae bacterium]
MDESLNDAVDRIVSRHREKGELVLLFDFDGTLVEFADAPAEAVLSGTVRQCLAALAALPGTTVGVISGRELEDLKQKVGLTGLYYAGTDGLELEFEGKVITHPLVGHCSDLVSRIAETLRPFVTTCPPTWLEQKRFGVTVHYRGLDTQLVPLLHEGIDQHLAPWAERLHVVTGGKAVEITPNIGWTKGTAVEFLLDHIDTDDLHILYAGDEACDVEAMWTVGMKGGISVGVGPGPPTIAEYKLPNAAAVERLLEELCRALGGHRSATTVAP